jgi:hypothetical protein
VINKFISSSYITPNLPLGYLMEDHLCTAKPKEDKELSPAAFHAYLPARTQFILYRVS